MEVGQMQLILLAILSGNPLLAMPAQTLLHPRARVRLQTFKVLLTGDRQTRFQCLRLISADFHVTM